VSIAAQVETQMGHGWPPVVKALESGLRPSLSIDVVTTVPGDMFTQMRAAFGAERARANAIWWERNEPATGLLTARQTLEMATVNGAHVAGLEDRTGSLTPGKKADVILIDTRQLNVAPVIDPVAAVALCADVSNVDTVIVNGVVRKWNGRLAADVDRARRLVEESSAYLVAEAARRKTP
jgi:cytosine/adenosine deaminase-related metal-dependent hydrolase